MKIVACLCSKDEHELIGPAIQHLRAIGVDHIIAVDARSTDGTRAFLENEAQGGTLELIDFHDTSRHEGIENEIDALVLERAKDLGADWILYGDADEFWLPQGGKTLHDCPALTTHDVISVPRYNVVVTPEGPKIDFPISPSAYDDILLFVTAIAKWRQVLTDDMTLPWITGVPQPKLMARPSCISATTAGRHNILAPGKAELKRWKATDLVIAHVPFTSLPRFERKIANIAAVIAANGDTWSENEAWHWRRFLENVEAQGAEAEFLRNTIDPETLTASRHDRSVLSATECFERLAQTL